MRQAYDYWQDQPGSCPRNSAPVPSPPLSKGAETDTPPSPSRERRVFASYEEHSVQTFLSDTARRPGRRPPKGAAPNPTTLLLEAPVKGSSRHETAQRTESSARIDPTSNPFHRRSRFNPKPAFRRACRRASLHQPGLSPQTPAGSSPCSERTPSHRELVHVSFSSRRAAVSQGHRSRRVACSSLPTKLVGTLESPLH